MGPVPRKEFRAKLVGMGPGMAWTCLLVPFSVLQTWGTKARFPVKGTINGAAYRSSVFPMGDGRHVMMVKKALQAAAGADQGERVKVVMEPDRAARKVTVPKDFKAALGKNGRAKAFFEGLAASYRKDYVDWITGAKRPETRARRIKQAVGMLAAGKKRM